MATIDTTTQPALIQLLLALADDKLMLGHRHSDWTGLAPILEEDIAFSSIAQDELAHASAIYELVAARVGVRADDLAFGRPPEAYRCASIVEIPDEFDWAFAICRQFCCDHFDLLRLERLGRSSDEPVAALARRLHAEERVHVTHADDWIGRLGRGTDESAQRLQAALTRLAPMAGLLCEPTEGQDGLEVDGTYPAVDDGGDMFDAWRGALDAVLEPAGLTFAVSRPDAAGGRRGRHTPHLATLLDEMCEVYRTDPGAAW
ncbi:MAG: 1,2-phenylacetyl-CoA epoxidase subunit PaaC [Planctomycetota bacterium]